MTDMDKTMDSHSTARLTLAHKSEVAKKRNATTFLWSYNKLIACFNCDTICHDSSRMTVETLLGFIERCCRWTLPDNCRLAMAPVELEPCSRLDDACTIKCQPVLPPRGPEVNSSDHVTAGDYILYFNKSESESNQNRQPGQAIIYKPTRPWHTRALFPVFAHVRRSVSFAERAHVYPPPRKIRDDLKAEALRLPHNHRGMCIVTGTQRTGSDEDRNGTTEVRWIYPPWSNDHDTSPTHSPESSSSEEDWDDQSRLEVPHNLVVMRKDVYDLFQDHAFGINLDVSPQGEIYVFHSAETVKKKMPYSSLAVEVQDKRSQDFLREHFHQCLMSGIIGEDVEDTLESNMNTILLKLQDLPDREQTKETEWPQDEFWNTETGQALKEWIFTKPQCSDEQQYSDED